MRRAFAAASATRRPFDPPSRASSRPSPLADADYVSVADPETLEELATIGDAGALLSTAVRIEGVRLIDNDRV